MKKNIAKKLLFFPVLPFFGQVTPPPGIRDYGGSFDAPGRGIILFANNVLKLIIVGAGIYAFINIIIAGYDFLGSAGDAKKVQAAWARIYNSLIGLLFVAGSFLLAAIFGWLLYKDPSAILSPKVYGP